jgi:hypothetical protein
VSATDFVILPGLILPGDAFRLALDLERRGFHLEPDGNDLLVGPRDRLTNEDRNAIRRWKQHLLAIAGFESPWVH